MYRQVLLQMDQRDLQRILWRKTSGSIQTFRLNTITYGLASAPFLAIRCLHQLAKDYKVASPAASTAIIRDFYVDDLITGGDDIEQLKVLKDDVTTILRSAGFEMHKWHSNEDSVFDKEDEETIEAVNFSEEVTTLGLVWNTKSDVFQYKFSLTGHSSKLTKRVILSIISQIFDPLGLIGPVTVRSKLLLQDLWRLKIDWDDPVPSDLQLKWTTFRDQLQHIIEISIPRHAFSQTYSRMELHGFGDASEVAYGACIYVKTVNAHGDITVNLLCAKSKVAPLKNISLPRLELCAALLLARLYQQVTQALTIASSSTYLWSVSTIALAWIKSEPSRWMPFVANRVTEIQQLTQQTKWNHVDSKDNPADIISRGLCPELLKNCKLWWHGPEWLQATDGPSHDEVIPNEDLPEERRGTRAFHVQTLESKELFLRFSSLSRLKRVVAYCLRFKQNTLSHELRFAGPLTVTEVERATTTLVLLAQQCDFPNEIRSLTSHRQVNKTSKLLPLLPFIISDT